MNRYRYLALDEQGREQRGQLEAETQQAANEALFAMRLLTQKLVNEGPVKVREEGLDWRAWFEKVRPEDLILFTKQLVTTIRVGIPIAQCLQTLSQQSDNPKLRRTCGKLERAVQEGSSLSAAMKQHPGVFSHLYCSVVAAGETSGNLPEVMDRLIYLIEHEAKVKAEVRNAMRYPVMVVAALVAAFAIMVGFVIPKFVTFFARSNLELPWPTRACLWMSDIFRSYGLIWFVLLVVAVVGIKLLLRTYWGQLQRDRLYLQIPLVRSVLIKAAMTRFASIFAILQSSGIMVLEAFEILSQTVGNVAIAEQFKQIGASLQEGRGIAEPLRESKYFPPLLISMVAVGEETGRLDEMLQKVSEHYDEELRYTMRKLTDSIGPVLIISLAAVVGFFALAIYMPMWDLTQLAQQR